MDVITAATMRGLLDQQATPCVSLYLPAGRIGAEADHAPIRLRNLLTGARKELVAGGMRGPDADDLLAEAQDLARPGLFWEHQEDGLAVFAAPDRTLVLRLPATFAELAVVADAFHVKPLWPVVAGDERLFVLALSRDEVRLLWADRFRVGEVDLPDDLPTSLAEALWYADPEKQLQHRGADRVGRGQVTARFHGHGGDLDRDEAKLSTFLRAVDEGLRHLVDDSALLVLAGVDELVGLFRKVSRHPRLAEGHVSGNPDELSSGQLHEQVLPFVQEELADAVTADAGLVQAGGDRAASMVADVVPAAAQGRVEVLFLPVGVQVWGAIASDGMGVDIHEARQPGDRDLLDRAGADAWSSGARVHAVSPGNVPGPGPVAALLRY